MQWYYNTQTKNILVHNDKLVIADFGLSGQLTVKVTSNSAYVEPQCYKQDNYIRDKKSDIYSLGVLLWEITSGYPPFSRISAFDSDSREQPIIGTPSAYINLYQKCWNNDPNLRPNIDNVFDILETISREKSENELRNTLDEIIQVYLKFTNTGWVKNRSGIYKIFETYNRSESPEIFNYLLNNQSTQHYK